MAIKIPKFDFKGIKRIEIPKTDKDFRPENGFGWAIIEKYLPKIMSDHQANANKIEFLYNYYLGSQDILCKERPHDVDKYNNNIIVENHANKQVNFKVGFLTSEKRDYTHKADADSDDLIYLDRYFTDVNFFSKDKALKKWIYATGIGTSFTVPRTDIIVSDGVDTITGQERVRFKRADEGFDVNYDSPFEYNTIDPKDNFIVYSSGFSKERLFCISIVDVDISTNEQDPNIVKQLQIETRYAIFKINSTLGYKSFDNTTKQTIYKTLEYIPMVEYSINDDRMGIIELNRSLLNSINTFRSAIADMTTDSANAILVFKNVDIDAEDVKGMKEAGAIVISDANNGSNSTADIDTIKLEIPFDGLNTYIEQLLQSAYSIVGVPFSTGRVSSGGDTGQARLVGDGWNDSYILIGNDINTLLGYDYEELKLILLICKQIPNCPINELYASQIDINYRVNQSDNFMVKTQGMRYLYEMNMPLEFILKVSKLSNDIKTDAKNWQERIDRIKAENQEDGENSDNPLLTDVNNVIGFNSET